MQVLVKNLNMSLLSLATYCTDRERGYFNKEKLGDIHTPPSSYPPTLLPSYPPTLLPFFTFYPSTLLPLLPSYSPTHLPSYYLYLYQSEARNNQCQTNGHDLVSYRYQLEAQARNY